MYSQIMQARFKRKDNSSNELEKFLLKNREALIKIFRSSRAFEKRVERLLRRAKVLKVPDVEGYILRSLKRSLGIKHVSAPEESPPGCETGDQRAVQTFRKRRLPSTHGPGADQE